ncbi:UDP-4-amino-4-deoxy-L-arabinose--oxoglutarate aminotransferase [Listeria grayi]|nr:aminotransferase class I/II-fold pyridoxal phosphate-dependent enzyme [Listeria grayi]VEI36660.1 UDP-4-amino-4-deoxy-L-arabinose--oxoglutarate aminotransferase [Listeria grayi]
MSKKIFLSPPDMGGEEQLYIKEAFDKNWIAPVGFHIDNFEQEITKYVGSRYAVAVSSGTAGLHLALLALGVRAGDIVFCPSFTFVASANPILYQRAIPVLIDSENETWNMSPNALKIALKQANKGNKLPKAVIVTHIYGQSAKIGEIKKICDSYQVPIIEDACESLGTIYQGRETGTIGEIGVYSFNGNKIITASSGGMIVTNHKELAEQIKYLSTQAKANKNYYHHEAVGYNYRMSNILAGIGRAQLKTLPQKIKKRRQVFQLYQEEFAENPEVILMPQDEKGTNSNRWLSVILLKHQNPNDLVTFLAKHNVESRRVWKPMHRQPILQGHKYVQSGDASISDELFNKGVCLPSGSNLTVEEQAFVIRLVNEFLNNRSEVRKQ